MSRDIWCRHNRTQWEGGGRDTYIHWMRPLWSRNVGQRVLSESRTNDCRPKVWTHLQTSSWTKTKRVTFSSFTSKHNRRDRPAKWQFSKWLCFADLHCWMNAFSISSLYGINVSGHQSIRIRISIEAIDRRVRCVPDMSSSNYSSALQKPQLRTEQMITNMWGLKLICSFLQCFQFVVEIQFNWSILSFSSWLHCSLHCIALRCIAHWTGWERRKWPVGNGRKFMQSQKLENKVCGVWLQ